MGWYGLYTPKSQNTSYYSGRYFTIQINSRTINQAASNLSSFIRSVTVHELGHALSLADNPNTTSTSIMKYSRNRNSLVSPTPYDRNNVSARY